MKILERKDWPSGAALYLARLRPDPESLVEFGQAPGAGTEGRPKWILHVAAQFGCPVGCRMCDAGALGYGGNLTAEEIVEQIRRMAADNKGLDIAGQPNVEIRLERMGEPSLNPQVLRALKLLAEEFPRPGILPWLSTVAPKSPAVAPFFKELIGVKNEFFSGGRFQLQFSLHSTDEKKRTEIVPIKKWSLDEIARYGERFFSPGDRKIILSFAPAPEERLDAAVLCR
ncbi:MAG: radical SAM protein, partial [Elusimicrobia bacterium]|nr:radical SAM protein [Elusimicrobiota bacterium]